MLIGYLGPWGITTIEGLLGNNIVSYAGMQVSS